MRPGVRAPFGLAFSLKSPGLLIDRLASSRARCRLLLHASLELESLPPCFRSRRLLLPLFGASEAQKSPP